MIGSLITLAIIVVVIFMLIGIYNKLVALKNRYENGFAQIEVQLKRRYDLIPNLVETAKAYLNHESETLTQVIEARNGAVSGLKEAAKNPSDSSAIQGLAGAENTLTQAMGKLNVVFESYPDLKANQNMMQLTEELSSTENKVAFARQGFNDFVTQYNTYRQSFPNIIIANNFGHTKDAQLLEFADTQLIQEAPKVSF
ncbi:LemA family protein [Marinicellulosiphila megalodicopiae]|uniref:LemA family protein n=1 Tax=Marinicellulosiphila megalodicopiae TaxID=2724896 RepID=UPI003BAF4A93